LHQLLTYFQGAFSDILCSKPAIMRLANIPAQLKQ